MIKISKNQLGFGTVSVVLLIVIVALIGIVGFMIYKDRTKATPATITNVSKTPIKSNAVSSNVSTTPPVDQYAGWKIYSSKFGFTFKYPATARVDDNTVDAPSINDKSGPNSVDVFVYADGYSSTNCPVTNPSAFPPCLVKVEFTLHSDTSANGVIVNSASFQLKQAAQLVIDSYEKKA